jgi:hypothetical protein
MKIIFPAATDSIKKMERNQETSSYIYENERRFCILFLTKHHLQSSKRSRFFSAYRTSTNFVTQTQETSPYISAQEA